MPAWLLESNLAEQVETDEMGWSWLPLSSVSTQEGGRMGTFDEMVRFLDDAWALKDQIVPCLMGPVGIGKTEAVMQHARNVGAGKVVTIIASQVLPNEVSGITMPVDATHSMEIYDHARLASLEDGDILFFDELLEADQMVLSACLTLIESRQMMSGRKLPAVQIVAATNPTVVASALRENIRQRFLFRSFSLDMEGVRDYIRKTEGVSLSTTVTGCLCCEGDAWNLLTPRTLTKLVRWLKATPEQARSRVAGEIDIAFSSAIGTAILSDIRKPRKSKEQQAKAAVRKALADVGADVGNSFEDSTIEEVMGIIERLPDEQRSEVMDALGRMGFEDDDTKVGRF